VCFSAVGGNVVDKLFDALPSARHARQDIGVENPMSILTHAFNPGFGDLCKQGDQTRAGAEYLAEFGGGLCVCHFLRWLPGQLPQGGTGFIGAGRWGGVLENMSQLYNSVVLPQRRFAFQRSERLIGQVWAESLEDFYCGLPGCFSYRFRHFVDGG
jgi:hypothetical protein